MDTEEYYYLVGVIDSLAALNMKIKPQETRTTGYEMWPEMHLNRREFEHAVFELLDDYADEQDVDYRIVDRVRKHSARFVVSGRNDVEQFLRPLLDDLVQRQSHAWLLVDEVIPALRNEVHFTKEGWYELMETIDQIRETSRSKNRLKYTREYFADEWAEELPLS